MKKQINDRIKELRTALAISQTEFAYQTGISHSLLTKIEAGDNPPTNKVIAKIVDKWKVAEDWLLSGKGELTYNRMGEAGSGWKDEAWLLAKTQIEKKDKEIEVKDSILQNLAISFDRVTKMMQDSGMSFLHPVAKTGT